MADNNSNNNNNKLGVLALAGIVVGAMIGGGIFSLPQNMAQGAAVDAVMLAWVVTGVGMFFIANTFRTLADACPDATTGIYAYARLGFGRFAGFQMAWAYWLSSVFGNVGYAVLLMDALNYFFPGTFTGGNNLWSILGGSLVIWFMCFMVMRGVHQAVAVNTIGTVCKLVPLAVFILIMLFCFRWSFFTTDMTGEAATGAAGHAHSLGGMLGQVKSTMLVTLWAFIGIEGAVVVSGRARSQSDVGKATLIGFLGCLIIYALLSILPFGRMYQPELAALNNPSTAPLLSDVVGAWGGWLMNLGVIVALLTSWLAFTIMIAQIPYAAALDGTFPVIFAKENAAGMPSVSLLVSSAVMQLAMVLVYFANNAWNTMLSVTAVMILPPYLACTAFLWKLCVGGKYPAGLPVKRGFALFCGVAGTVYAAWMIYAAGVQYLFMAFIVLALGIPVFVWARCDARRKTPDDRKIFSQKELVAVILIVLLALGAVIGFLAKEKFIQEKFHKWSHLAGTEVEEVVRNLE